MTPSVGRIVHYVEDDGTCLAAIIVDAEADDVGEIKLAVFAPWLNSIRWIRALQDLGKSVGTWHEPERV